jgi:Fe-S-cluster-containing dehydrogenase component/formate-dependent nitrite reductase membrane component NrfD
MSVSRWAKVIDNTRCIGCHACSTACKSENVVPLSVTRTYVKYVDVGAFPQARRLFQVTRCNQCGDPPCARACPTGAMYQRPDGLVDFDKRRCIGCKACMAACPYDAIFINPRDGSAEKCNFCAHRLELGLEPACVVVCPVGAILVGDLHDPRSRVAQIVHREPVTVRRPEKATSPALFYRASHQAALDPLGAERPAGSLFMWAEQFQDPHAVVGGNPDSHAASIDATLSYDVPHRAPWDWRVSAYTWTKGIAAGAYLVPLLLVAFGALSPTSALWQWVAPVVAGFFLAATGVLLIADLEHPEWFYFIFTKAHWRSWLVRGGLIISAYAAVLAIHFAATLLHAFAWQNVLMWPGAPLAVLTAIYTAYLFGQARARDLWESPLLPAHLLTQTALAGAAVLVPFAMWLEPPLVTPLRWTVCAASIVHLAFVASDITMAHPTMHAKVASWEMTRGRFARLFWAGAALVVVAATAPAIGVAAAVVALVGLALHEHAYVQAGQAVPLA